MRSQQTKQGMRKARKAGLHYVHDLDDGWCRRRSGRGFAYFTARGKRLAGERTLKRISALAIPPAWESVRICPSPHGHIQAVGMDAKGRRQYLYHDDWHEISSTTKFDRLLRIGSLLPRVRRRVRKDLNAEQLTKERVVAAVIRLIDKVHLRVGSPVYVEGNGSHGATTLTAEQVVVDDITISLDFPGKSGKQTEALLTDAKVASVIQQCEEIDEQFLFCYRDDEGGDHAVTSSDVNRYLQEVAGEALSAKDFRTWSASVIALKHLKAHLEQPDAVSTKRAMNKAIEMTANEMGHTKAICKQSYIHPVLLEAFGSGRLSKLLQKYAAAETAVQAELTRDEDLFVAVLSALAS